MKYSDQLEQEEWQVKRRKILTRDGFKCVQCGYKDKLQVHHLYYVHFKKAWQYPNNALVTLCGRCHEKWHEEHNIELRENSYTRGKKYTPPKKTKSRKKKVKEKGKIKPTVLPETKDQRKKRLAVEKLKQVKLRKMELINSSNVEDKEKLIKKIDSFTEEQLKKYLEYK